MTPERWRRLKELLGGAIERTGNERASFLAQSCAGDEGLRSEVDALLASHESQGGLLDAVMERGGADPAKKGPEPLGRIGPYQLLEEIGQGGMGTVYLSARVDEEYRKTVAIKVIRRGMDCEFVVARFRNERQILAGLAHPGIAALLDGGTTDDGLPYFVMEHVEGEPIDRWASAARSSTPTAASSSTAISSRATSSSGRTDCPSSSISAWPSSSSRVPLPTTRPPRSSASSHRRSRAPSRSAAGRSRPPATSTPLELFSTSS
jgi:hypothetical protein